MALKPVYMECHDTETVNGKLVKHNKFYSISDNGDETLTVWYGPLKDGKPTAGTKKTYPISEWWDIIDKRKDHGYKEANKNIIDNVEVNKQLKKVETLLKMMHINSTYEMRLIQEKYKEDVVKKKLKLEAGRLLTKDDMIFLNEVYVKVKEI